MSLVEVPIVYEEAGFVAVNKPSGLLVHGTKILDEYSLADWLKEHYPETASVGDNPAMRPGMVHRLDKETSGVLLVARTSAYFEYLKSLFQNREMKKVYYAVVRGDVEPKRGVIDKPISIRHGSVKRTVHEGRMRKEALTEYVSRGFNEASGTSFLEIMPRTGRTHQIRVHLASIGHPVLGDRLYGRGKHDEVRLMLHAYSLEFATMEGKRVKIEAELPQEFKAFARYV